jgi:hypothetical protein
VNIHEHFADAFECGDGNRHVVDERGTPAGTGEPPRENKIVFIEGGLKNFGGGAFLFGAGEFEPAGNA